MNLMTLPFEDATDFKVAHAMARKAGRDDLNCSYTTTSAIIGLNYHHRYNGDVNTFSIVKTKELGFLLIQDLEDLCIRDEFEEKFPHIKI